MLILILLIMLVVVVVVVVEVEVQVVVLQRQVTSWWALVQVASSQAMLLATMLMILPQV